MYVVINVLLSVRILNHDVLLAYWAMVWKPHLFMHIHDATVSLKSGVLLIVLYIHSRCKWLLKSDML